MPEPDLVHGESLRDVSFTQRGIHYKELSESWTSMPHDFVAVGLNDMRDFDPSEFDTSVQKLINRYNEAMEKVARAGDMKFFGNTKENKAKYIVLRDAIFREIADVMYVFPAQTAHSKFMEDIRKKGVSGSLLSAGFVGVPPFSTRRIYGSSDSLEKKNWLTEEQSNEYREKFLQPKLAEKGFVF